LGLIDGIGYAGLHEPDLSGLGQRQPKLLKAAVEKFAELGLEIHITELSINTEGSSEELFEKQAERYQTLFRILSELKDSPVQANVTNVTVFGIMDSYMFYADDTNTTRLFGRTASTETGLLRPCPT